MRKTKTQEQVVKEILKYAKSLWVGKTPTGKLQFTDDKEANRFLLNDKTFNAFFVGVLFDQGIKAERGWAVPYHLKQRLGHFDIKKITKMKPKNHFWLSRKG